jgi:hypothetical protein
MNILIENQELFGLKVQNIDGNYKVYVPNLMEEADQKPLMNVTNLYTILN